LIFSIELVHFDRFGRPEVNYPDIEIRSHDNIFKFKVSMDDVLRMNMWQPIKNLSKIKQSNLLLPLNKINILI